MTAEPHRRRSKAVNLVLVGVAGTAASLTGGCSKATYQRNVYSSMQDCAADYSQSTCSAHGSQGFGNFIGPVYRLMNGVPSSCRSNDPGGGPTFNSRKIATQIERNGFGVSCRGSSSRSSSSSSSSRHSFWGG